MKTLTTLGVLAAIAVVLGMTVVGAYNTLAQQNVVVDEAQAKIESQLQRRYDLIPNLVASTRGFLSQEQAVFGDIAEARTRYTNAPAGSPEKIDAANQTESALARLMVIVENYPQLTSNATVQSLMDELSGTENRVSIARDRYNEAVSGYNKQVKTFPTNLLASLFNMGPREFFEAEKNAGTAPAVDLEVKSRNND